MSTDVVTAELTPDEGELPLVLLFHGRGANELTMLSTAQELPQGFHYVSVRAPISEGGGYAWFANRGIGRPVTESLRTNIDWFRSWFDGKYGSDRAATLIGFSGGAAFIGGVILDDPKRFRKAALLFGTLPWDAGLPTGPDRLVETEIFFARGMQDTVIPIELMDRTEKYLEFESGTSLTKEFSTGGHGLTTAIITRLGSWLTQS